MQTDDDEEYFTVDDAMKYLRVSRATIERWIKAEGITKYHRPGRRQVFLKKAEVEQLKKFRPKEDE